MKKVAVVIPTLNEENHIYDVLEGCSNIVSIIFVVDGLSHDMTPEIIRRFPGAELLLERTPGKGAALRKGLSAALASKPDYIVMLDGDGEKTPKDIPGMIECLKKKNADMVVGFRKQKRSFKRSGFNFFASWWIRIATGYDLRDCLSGFNVMRAESLKNMALTSNHFEIETELILESRRNILRVIEYPLSPCAMSPTKLKRIHMREINRFFDLWVLEWIKSVECDLPIHKKLFLKLFCNIGLLLSS